MTEQLTKRHKIIRYCRKPICALIVSMIVILYSFDSFAAPTDIQSEPLTTYYNISDVSSINPLSLPSFQALYTSLGYNSSNLKLSINQSRSLFYTNTPIDQSLTQFYSIMNNTSVVTSFVNGVAFDFSKAYSILFPYASVQYDHARSCLRCMSPSGAKIYLVCDNDGYWYAVSNDPFICYEQADNNFREVNTKSANGLYCIMPKDINVFNAIGNSGLSGFTDMDILIPSTDGHSGFTSFTTSVTDLNPNSSDNVNFNILKNDGLIVGGGDPVDDADSYGDYAKSRMNFSMSSFYTGGKNLNYIAQHITLNWPEAVTNNPNHFCIIADYSGRFKDQSMGAAKTYDFTLDGHVHQSIPLTSLMVNGRLPSQFNVYFGLNDMIDGDGYNMFYQYMGTVASFINSTLTTVNDNDLWKQFLNTTGLDDFSNYTVDIPLAKLTSGINSYIDIFDFTGYIQLAYDADDDWSNGYDYITGSNVTKFDFKTGESSLVSSDNTINQYPQQGQDSYQLPATGNNGDLGYVVNGGGAPSAHSNAVVNSIVEYLFNLDASDLISMQGNIHNQFQTIITDVADTGNNGFWYVLKETTQIIPDRIWGWITTCCGAILLVAVYKAYINSLRWK